MNDQKSESKPASDELRCMELLADLDAQYKHLVAVRHTSVWGGNFERERVAAMEIKITLSNMLDTLIKLMEARSANAPDQRPGAKTND